MVAWRYLRSRRKEAFISVIAGFSFVGIMLGVATLIIVMAVMNGFRTELISRILGINGHMIVQPIDQPFNNYDEPGEEVCRRSRRHHGPSAGGRPDARLRPRQCGFSALVRGVRQEDIDKVKEVATNIKTGDLVGFMAGDGVLVGSRLAAQARRNGRRRYYPHFPGRRRDADGRQSACQILQDIRCLRDRHVGI